MTVQKIIHDQLFLRQKSTLANKTDLPIAFDLRDTLIANQGRAAGLAANMIGQSKRIIAFYAGMLPLIMINPQIIKRSGKYFVKEGCLSLSGERQALRYQRITVVYQDLKLNKMTQEFTGFVAETIQHEVDHCNGILI